MTYPNEVYWLALSQWSGIGPVYGMKVLKELGHPKLLFEMPAKELQDKFEDIPAKIWNEDRSALLKWAEKQFEKANKYGVKIISLDSDEYPLRFRHFEQMPMALFYKGEALLNSRRIVGIIGTRAPTEQGKLLCEKFIADLKAYDPLIVSGLAYGIDITAHRAALSNGLDTIGIMGTGMQEIYPFQHRATAAEMTEQGGILSQFPFGEGPDREHFPMRNKLIAAMSDALVVVESKRKGGSMITAQFANDYNKDVFAFPGRPGELKSEGCNLLIKSHRASLIESTDDIAYVMRWEKTDQPREVQRKLFIDLSADEEKVLDQIRKQKEISIDQLSQALDRNVRELANVLLQLEFKSLIKSLPGNRYIST